jgi:hypothetical protein
VERAERAAGRWWAASPRAASTGSSTSPSTPRASAPDGLTLRLPDFELRMDRGTLFTSPPAVGPTALVFVGEGTVRVSPDAAREQEQLPAVRGKARDGGVGPRCSRASTRRPAPVLSPVACEPDRPAAAASPAADRFFSENVPLSFVLDASLPGLALVDAAHVGTPPSASARRTGAC